MAKKGKSKQRSPASQPNQAKTTAGDDRTAPTAAQRSRRGGRETVDALVVAFVLAFLIRTFQAEAFVIPTGSMAPTLMGRHKDVFCDQCGTRFKVNSSDDRADYAPILRDRVASGQMTAAQAQAELDGVVCVGGQCPQCRRIMLLDDEAAASLSDKSHPVAAQTGDYSGDRLIVSKSAYSFTDPQRWDVAVFKYPGNSQTNYIKRVVGLPEEELRLFQGDVFVRPLGEPDGDFAIARKPAEQVLAMMQFVHDTHHESRSLIDAGWPLAWSGDGAWESNQTPGLSTYDAPVYQATYRCDAPADGEQWLRYRHTPPNENVWRRVLEEEAEVETEPTPQLITDFTPYNTRLNLEHARDLRQLSLAPRLRHPTDLGRLGLHWVGDLVVEADLRVESEAGRVSLDLVEAGDHYGVTIDTATGDATFWRRTFEENDKESLGSAKTSVRGPGAHKVRLANVDSRLLLWIDGKVAAEAPYDEELADAVGPAQVPKSSEADPGDLAPAGVAIEGGALAVERLRLWRDGYYIATSWKEQNFGFTTDLPPEAFDGANRREYGRSMVYLSSDSELWPALANRRRVDFKVDAGQLFMLGDNSGWSLDSRLWAGGNQREPGKPGGPYLERDQLVGKAVCVYWPHSWYRLPVGFQSRSRLNVPVWPNFQDMRLVE